MGGSASVAIDRFVSLEEGLTQVERSCVGFLPFTLKVPMRMLGRVSVRGSSVHKKGGKKRKGHVAVARFGEG